MSNTATRSHPHQAWQVRESDFPREASVPAQLEFLVSYAVLAPSTHNTQPWLFRVRQDGIDLFADGTRRLAVADPQGRELVISCGAALYNLRVALGHFGFRFDCRHLPDPSQPDLLASIDVRRRGETSAADAVLISAMLARRTNRGALASDRLPDTLLERLQQIAGAHSCRLTWVRPEQRTALTGLIARAAREQMHHKAYRQELARWLHSDYADAPDGMPGYAVGEGGVTSLIAPWLVQLLDVGRGEAVKECGLATDAPVLAVLGTVTDTARDWLATGEALAAILLRARIHGVWASFFNGALELPGLRDEVAALTGIASPHMIARFGYGTAVRATPRRAAEEVIARDLA